MDYVALIIAVILKMGKIALGSIAGGLLILLALYLGYRVWVVLGEEKVKA